MEKLFVISALEIFRGAGAEVNQGGLVMGSPRIWSGKPKDAGEILKHYLKLNENLQF